jgi:glycosyltransferase involved in cell wall biosynthesis
MRLLFIANDFPSPRQPTRGTFNLNLVKGLARRHEVRVIAPISWVERLKRGKSPQVGSDVTARMEGSVQVLHPTYYYTPKILRSHYGWFFWRSIRPTIQRMLQSYTPDAVIGYWLHPDGEAAVRIGKPLGIPSAVIVGGSDLLLLPKNPSRARCVHRTLEQADTIFTVSDHLRRRALEMGVDPKKVHVCYQGVDAAKFAPGNQRDSRVKLALATDIPMLLWVGRMVPVKALDVLIDACSILCKQAIPFRLCLVGDGPLRASLQARVASAGLGQNIHFAGSQLQESLPDWYRAADVMVLSSLSEGIPNVLREATASGTPFVATNVGGIPEIADPQIDHLVPPSDAAALAAAMERGLSRPRPAPGSHKVRSTTWEQSADDLVDILRSFIDAKAAKVHRPCIAEAAFAAAGTSASSR